MRIHAADTTVPVLATGKTRTGRRVAAIYTLIETASSTTSDPQARNAAILARLPDHPAKRIGDLFLPRNPPAQAAPARVEPPWSSLGAYFLAPHAVALPE